VRGNPSRQLCQALTPRREQLKSPSQAPARIPNLDLHLDLDLASEGTWHKTHGIYNDGTGPLHKGCNGRSAASVLCRGEEGGGAPLELTCEGLVSGMSGRGQVRSYKSCILSSYELHVLHYAQICLLPMSGNITVM